MSDLVCAICGSKNTKNLINIDTGQLRDLYDIVCGIKTQFIEALPSYFCLLCVSHLSKFHNVQNQFRTGLQTSQELYSLIQQDPENNIVIDRSEVTIHPVLSHSEPDKMKYFEMKHQPYSIIKFKRQNENQTGIPSFHIHINNMDEVNDVSKIDCVIKDDKQFDSVYQDSDSVNQINDVRTERNNNLNSYAPAENFNFNMELNEKSIADCSLESLTKILHIKPQIRSIETFMVVQLLKHNEAKAVNELWANKRNRHLSEEGKENVCDICLFYVNGDMDIHKKEHEESEFSCNICFTKYLTHNILQQHCINVHIFKYICRICNEVLFKFSDARCHLRYFHNKSLNELGEVNEERNKAYLNLETHFERQLSTPQEATEIMLKSYDRYRKYVTCDICMKKIRNQVLLEMHRKKHVLLPGQVQCDVCKYVFGDKSALRRHYKDLHKWKYSCKHCDYVTSVRKLACSHKIMHLTKGNVQTYKCEECDKVYNKSTSLATHVRLHHPCNAICNICGESYSKYRGVRKHIKMTHTEKEHEQSQLVQLNPDPSSELYCKECEVQFINQDGYDRHLQSSGKHTAVNEVHRKKMRELSIISVKNSRRRLAEGKMAKEKVIHACHICGVVKKNNVLLRYHYHKYHRDDPYYLTHLRKEYKCDQCDYTTYYQGGVYLHKRNVHSSLRPFKCPQCEMAFKSKANMIRHIAVHTQERPYECAICNKFYTTKSSAQLHIQTVHEKKPYPPWQNKSRKSKERKQEGSKKTTNKRRKYSDEDKQEVVEEQITFDLEAQELATDYIMKENMVYSTISSENRGLPSSYVLSINEP